MILTKKQRESLSTLPAIKHQPTNKYYLNAFTKKIKFEDRYILEIDYYKNNELIGREFYFDINNYYQQKDLQSQIKKGLTPLPVRRDYIYSSLNAEQATIQQINKFFKIETTSEHNLRDFKNLLTQNRRISQSTIDFNILKQSIDNIPLPNGLAEAAKHIKENYDRVAIMNKKSRYRYPCVCMSCNNKFYAYRYHHRGYSYGSSSKLPSIVIPDYGTVKTDCPHCGNDIELIYYNSNDYRTEYAENISIFQMVGENLILRVFHINRDTQASLEECDRFIMTPTINKRLRKINDYDYYSDSFEHKWKQCSDSSLYGFDIGYIFKPSLQELKHTKFDIPFIMNRLEDVEDKREYKGIIKLLSKVKPKNKYLMLLYSKGFTSLADEIIDGTNPIGINRKGQTAAEILGGDISYWKKFGDISKMSYLQWRVLTFLKGQQNAVEIYNKIFKIKITQYRDINDDLYKDDFDRILRVLKIGHPLKMVNYLIKQNISYQDYIDLIAQYKRLDLNITENMLYPKSYFQTHNELNIMENELREKKKIEEAKAKDDMFFKAVKKWKKLNYETDGLAITLIITASELQKEAIKMQNCSASYISRIIDKKCVIFKIRQTDKPDDGFFMLELSADYKIIQCRGIRNTERTEEINAFLKKWRSARFKVAN